MILNVIQKTGYLLFRLENGGRFTEVSGNSSEVAIIMVCYKYLKKYSGADEEEVLKILNEKLNVSRHVCKEKIPCNRSEKV